ncbi:MAG: phosphotransacetylase [Mycoplasmataceae bacterium]|nr:phosphotransacetylase [Mycoplasmataceae bacterium]
MNFKKYAQGILEEKNKEFGKRKIVFMEGESRRMRTAALSLETFDLIDPITVFETRKSFMESNRCDTMSYYIIEEEKELVEKLVKVYVEKRKGKETEEEARELMKKTEFFSSTLVEAGLAHGAIGGILHPTSDILRGAFKAIGPAKGVKTISSIMIMHKQDQFYLFTDISVNVSPTAEQLVEIARNAADFGDYINFKKKIAFLSFSTAGSAQNEMSRKIKEATNLYVEKYKPYYDPIGEIQFDAAFDLEIRKLKYKDGGYSKTPTIFVFPDLNSGNIGYKIAQRMGSWGAIGPIVTGLNKPINDLSRGSTIDDVFNTGILTALQSFDKKDNKWEK